MNINKEDEESPEAKEARSLATAEKPSEKEPAGSTEAADSREVVEGGYGWGV